MKTGKSPGFDGIRPEAFLTFWPQLGPLLFDMIQFSIKNGSFSRDTNTAIISLILKKDRDPTACSSYRALSLLNSEIKLFAKVLAKRLDPFMTFLVHHDQTGFIKSRLASDNVRRLLHIIEGVTHVLSP